MKPSSAQKVGIVTLIALVTFSGLYLYLSHFRTNTYTVRVAFSNTLGLLRQSQVRMQGVAIGEVIKIELDTEKRPPQPVVTLSIDKRYTIPTDSKFIIISGILITNPQVEIRPGAARTILSEDVIGPVITGQQPAGALETFSPELQKTVLKLNSSFENLNTKFNAAYGKIDKILDQSQKLMVTVNDAASNGRNLIADPKLKRSLLATVSNFQEVSNEARVTSRKLSADLNDIVRSNKGNLEGLSGKLTNLLTRVDATLDDANTIVKRVTEQVTDPRLQQSLQETAELARTTLARFNQIASDLDQFVGDPSLRGDLKETVGNFKGITDRGNKVLTKIDDLLGKLSGPDGKGPRAPRLNLPKVQIVGNVSEQFDPSRLRVDVDAQILLGQRNLLDLGLYDLGQDTRLNLQAGNRMGNGLTARYGLYASKLGAGLDWTPTPGTGLRADLWDTNHPRLDVRGLYGVNKNASIWIGADSLLRRPVPLIGIQLRN